MNVIHGQSKISLLLAMLVGAIINSLHEGLRPLQGIRPLAEILIP